MSRDTSPAHVTGAIPTNAAASMWPASIACYDITLPTLAEDLAFDEVLLTETEHDPTAAVLRFWSPTEYAIVLGRSNRPEQEARLSECLTNGIPILRRASGGGAVIVGPGCLCYSLVLPLAESHRALGSSGITSNLMSRTAAGLSCLLSDIQVCGTSDLVWQDRKFSGNAQRWLRNAFIHHGTILYNFDLEQMVHYLSHPTREPTYRVSRPHGEFVTNIPVTVKDLKAAICGAWNAIPSKVPTVFQDQATLQANSRYRSAEWQISPSVE